MTKKFMSKLIKLSIICLLIFNIFSIGVLTVSATEPLLPTPNGPLPTTSINCGPGGSNCGNYTLNDMLGVVSTVSNFILGIVGSLALLAFVYGGVMWMISAGDAEKVMTGKRAIIGAVVGLAIVFTSFMIIQLVYSALGIDAAKEGNWAVSNWFK